MGNPGLRIIIPDFTGSGTGFSIITEFAFYYWHMLINQPKMIILL
jgi:hypothetical protein